MMNCGPKELQALKPVGLVTIISFGPPSRQVVGSCNLQVTLMKPHCGQPEKNPTWKQFQTQYAQAAYRLLFCSQILWFAIRLSSLCHFGRLRKRTWLHFVASHVTMSNMQLQPYGWGEFVGSTRWLTLALRASWELLFLHVYSCTILRIWTKFWWRMLPPNSLGPIYVEIPSGNHLHGDWKWPSLFVRKIIKPTGWCSISMFVYPLK